jgi:DNA invertase Pin-like site-specific DNA recombinase
MSLDRLAEAVTDRARDIRGCATPRAGAVLYAAIYARKSTEQTGISDEAKSIARQIEHSTAYAHKKGWVVLPEHVYTDDGVSGAEFLKRAGFSRLMNALRPRPPFQVLIMSEESRLGREQIETAYALKQITDAGVRVFLYLEDRERTLDNAMEKVMASLTNFVSEAERERARQRTRDAMSRKAKAGYVAGGKVYGYRNVEIRSTTNDGTSVRDHVEREIVEAEGAVIQRIFQMSAAGAGIVRIAKTFNAEGVPSPRGRGWAPSAVREILYRPLYRGQIVWGKTARVDRGGTRAKRRCAKDGWMMLDAPALRIVPEELWIAAHDRLSRKREAYIRRAGGRLWGRPEAGIESRYLLTGFALCGTCGGTLGIRRRSKRGHARTYYVCMFRHMRGATACATGLTIEMERANSAVLNTLLNDVLTPELVELTIKKALERYATAPNDIERERKALDKEVLKVGKEVTRLTDLLAASEPSPALLAALKDRERRSAEVQAKLAHLDGISEASRALDLNGVRQLLTDRLADWQGLLQRQPAQARQILRRLLSGRLLFTPRIVDGVAVCEYTGQANYGRLLKGIIATSAAVDLEQLTRIAVNGSVVHVSADTNTQESSRQM